ncbi:putative membrane protein [Humibacillus xanthopallidus]|uniref:Putative membrane protein n=1 Tax=Humibacillus xanthopallidus TaxID=412689 RepID=A0A543PUH4_9MICO|nr:hypothetical protein [Humibacillus xanthopallidus]TQN47732.1 putative membrane protein [Humibacillus xanthopallidus]
MATIIAFGVPDPASGRQALNRLTGLVDDTALAFRDADGTVTVHQASDLDGGPSDIGHGLLGVLVAVVTSGSLGMATSDERLDCARRDLARVGVDVEGLDIASAQIDAGAAAAFMVAQDDTAVAIESALRSAGYRDVRSVRVPQEGVDVLRATQQLG